MGNVTVFSNKSANFNHPKDYSTVVNVRALTFETVPDWVLDSKMFQLLKKENSIRIIESNKDLKDVEVAGKVKSKEIFDAVKETVAATAVEVEVDELVEEDEVEVETSDYSQMSSKQLYTICVEKGLNVEPKLKKEDYIKVLAEEV
jgi:hypothetical protein